ncbi:MAG: T9SS type A sorting domain-containing protein [Crocinitomix sp.]|nr:T9SS type A sorting domain-containing protein [Crocinitomix sp.]
MKTFKHALIVLACLCYTSSSTAQTVLIYDYFDTLTEPVNLSGTVVNAIPGGSIKRFFIQNTSELPFNFRIERVKIEVADGAADYFAFGQTEGIGSVYSAVDVSPHDSFMSPDTFLLGLETDGYLGSHYIYYSSEGCSQYRYYVINDSTQRIDSVGVRFCAPVVTIAENEFGISLYPNPAQNQITIASANNVLMSNLIITDLAGKIVYSELIQTNGNSTIDLANLEKGIYVVTLIDPLVNEQIFNTKLVLE